jgi:signal transduction histidine kinase
LRDPEGVVTGLQGLFFNITALKQAERRSRQVAEKLEQANTGLRRSNMELAQFAGMISHDLQAPLGTVHGLVDRVLVRELAELRASSRQALTHALDSLDRMRRMVSDLLRISRVRNAERAPEVVDSRLACAQALANLRVDLEARGGQVYLAPMPEVLARFTLVMQLFQNLFHNALKFSGDRVPLIRVGWRRDGQRMARFWVRDNGIGIPAGHEERIFEIYERGDRARDLPGSGVGLALCRRIVEQEGGRIWVESEPGVGSTFYFTLPLAQTVSPAAVPALENTP